MFKFKEFAETRGRKTRHGMVRFEDVAQSFFTTSHEGQQRQR
jgi:hypothetical protein